MISTTTQSSLHHLHRALQYDGDKEDYLSYINNSTDNGNNIMDHDDAVNNQESSSAIDGQFENTTMSNLSDDNIMSWFDNNSTNTYNNTANLTNNPFLNNTINPIADGGSSYDNNSGGFDPKVFWSVNAFILVLFVTTILWCCFGKKEWLFHHTEERRQASDEIYRRNVLRRRRQQEEARVETPAQRTKKLLKSFALNNVQMTVKEEDLIEDDPYHTPAEDNNMMNDIETGSMEDRGQLKLTNGNLVPNCCAICLTCYDVDDVVVWSSNESCAHAFHQDCVVGWLVKMQPETPCPCCRQEFTDLEAVRKEAKITWGRNAFNVNALSF